uniref:Uncharacterized protein n=1 Tax=Ipomoea trifida TaxID=35884 RepID=A0A911_IPOTF|nr:hypothetical protein [Ipomoea trifida]
MDYSTSLDYDKKYKKILRKKNLQEFKWFRWKENNSKVFNPKDYPVFDFTSAQYGYGPKNIHQVFCVGDLIAPLQEGNDWGFVVERFHG